MKLHRRTFLRGAGVALALPLFDLLPLLEDTLTLLENRLVAQKTGIHIERRYGVKEAWTLADGDKIKQVFWNFSENAVRAMRDGGTLSVSLDAAGNDWQRTSGQPEFCRRHSSKHRGSPAALRRRAPLDQDSPEYRARSRLGSIPPRVWPSPR